MRKVIALCSILIGMFVGACIFGRPVSPILPTGVITIEAQALPITKTLAWDENDASVTDYPVTLDGATVGDPTGTTFPITFTTQGPHTITITAKNLWGTSSPATLAVIVALPKGPSNARIQ